jgi:hypothetical protein
MSVRRRTVRQRRERDRIWREQGAAMKVSFAQLAKDLPQIVAEQRITDKLLGREIIADAEREK